MYASLLLPDLKEILAANDAAGMKEFCEALHPGVVAEVLTELESEEAWQVLSHCDLQRRVEIFEYLSLSLQAELAQGMDRVRLSRLVQEMAPDDRVDLLSRLDPERVESLLPMIAQAERSDIRKLLSFPEESAGAIMTTEYASLSDEVTVKDAIDRLRQQAPNRETIYYVFILGEGRHLEGIISLRELILAKPAARISDIMSREVISVRVDDDQEFVAQELARFDLLAIPVVDSQNRLVGIVTHDDAFDVVREEATEDAYRAGAVEPMEDGYLDTPLIEIAWKRGVWLLFLAVVALFTAEVLLQYESVSAEYKWMVLFLPLVLASGGNAGSQSATLIIRTLALGEMTARNNLRMTRREILVGLMLGVSLAMVGFLAALFWFALSMTQAGVVALTVLLVVMMGTFSGATLPLMFKKMGMDPALMSNPLIAALVDVLGVVIYYNVALSMLGAVAD